MDFKYNERGITTWLKMKKVFATMKHANVIVTKTQCLDAETKRGNTARRKVPIATDIHRHNRQ